MRTKRIVLPAMIFLSIGLVACGNNEGANNGRKNNVVPMGYYSNENHEKSGGNANWLNQDNDGPLTEMMDHTFGGEGQNNGLRGINNQAAPQGRGNIDTLFSRSDQNYHGHLNDNNGRAKSGYYTAYDGNLAKKISHTANSVVNVGDARTVVHKDHVLIGAVLEDPRREHETKAAIRDAVDPHLKGKSLTIVTNESSYNQIRSIDNSLRSGEQWYKLDKDLGNMFRQIKNTGNNLNR
ncbi:YhcN/YlaJ family sporulation lipoprotein [Robertmurraya andreesenii]|uniref:Spore cortex protein n=1 Tax=Anoxybacillus andreesenii TaxID=1325932 RepID=A0ABT9V567_9BACL|nr:YhcN/YlaJ family sporulation lipoprotein [Robertmurraya andreesenii]MDQ0156097.1 spore cortex protein [Robertmurraya andreesenii]